MQRMQELNDEYKKLTWEVNEAKRQEQVVFSRRDSWKYHVAEYEAKLKLLKQK